MHLAGERRGRRVPELHPVSLPTGGPIVAACARRAVTPGLRQDRTRQARRPRHSVGGAPPASCGRAAANRLRENAMTTTAVDTGRSRHPPPHRHDRRREHLLPRGRPAGRARPAAAARLPDLLAHVPQPDPGPRRPLPRDRAGLSGLRPERHAGPRRLSPTPSTASPSWWTACSTGSGSSASPCTSWTTARRSAGGWR